MFGRSDKNVRHSYDVQTEEFRSLNADLTTYLNEMKILDDDNRQLQQMIDEIRKSYLIDLENHLLRVPENFRDQSRKLTSAHLERYKFKCRARRFVAEREEFKRRIHFVAADEKQQLKHLKILEKQHRAILKENQHIVEQLETFFKHLEKEKSIHRQAMDRVDQLQHEYERICVERSRSEFEIQSLKEEVQLMQTAREFLDDERDLFISSQTEAQEYFLSHLNESIQRIRDDFEQLNRSQLKQIENDYEEKLRSFDNFHRENSSSTSSSSDVRLDEFQRLQNDYRLVTQELNIVNEQNQTLTKHVQQMEVDLYVLKEDRRQKLETKDHEFERNQIELQTLNEQLTHLAEYDRNLKFELTLYRRVLENEYRRTTNKRKTKRTEKTTAFPIEIDETRVRLQSDYDPLETNDESMSPMIEIQPPSSVETSTTSLKSVDQCIDSSSSSIQTVVEQTFTTEDFRQQTISILPSKDLEEILTKTSAVETSVDEEQEEEEEVAQPASSSSVQLIGDLSSIVIRQIQPDELSNDSSLTDVEEITSSIPQPIESTEPKLVDDEQDPTVTDVMQDLHEIFNDLANADGLVEINVDLPENLLDRLEFRDNLIRTLFDSLLRKYLVRSAAQSNRSTTMDWIEFRDILFPIITGRRTERQIRTLFDLFDTNKNGYLSLQEIAELLEILQANDTIDLAQNIINEFDSDRDGKLSADELIEAIKKRENVETKQWFRQTPTDELNASLEVSIGTSAEKIIELAQIFRRLGLNRQTHSLDSFRENLTSDLIVELIKLKTSISNDDLERLVELFIEKRQQTDPFVSWTDFRDFFLPIVQDGTFLKDDVQRYFDLLDTFHRGFLTNDEILQLLRFLQITTGETILNKFEEKIQTHVDPNGFWSFDELILALENVDETARRILSSIDEYQQRDSFDFNWFTNEIDV